jgi:hypothetical protein
MHLCQVGSGACTGTHTVCFALIISVFEGQDIDAPIHLGAVFSDLQPYPNLGAWHGSECKSSVFCRESRYFRFLMSFFFDNFHLLAVQ